MATMTLEIVANRIAELEKHMAAVLVKINLDEKPKKEKKEKKEKSPKADKEEKPKKKRGITGYLLFSKENRASVKEEMGDVKPTEVVTQIAKMWKELDDDEREEWNKRAKEINEEGVMVD